MLPLFSWNPLSIPAKMPTEIIGLHHGIYMAAIAFTGAIMVGSGSYILASGFAAKNSEKDTQEKDKKHSVENSKKWSLRKVPGYVWAGLGLVSTGISGIIFSSKLANLVESACTNPIVQESPQQ
jgi:hypothetical protein